MAWKLQHKLQKLYQSEGSQEDLSSKRARPVQKNDDDSDATSLRSEGTATLPDFKKNREGFFEDACWGT